MSNQNEKERGTGESFILRAGAFEQEGSSVDEYAVLIEGLRASYNNYELYFMLGLYYRYRNADQAYLCFENALHYCDEPEDETVIREAMEDVKDRARVRGTSIVIVSYNDLELIRECIKSIRRYTLKGSYEIVVVDNASSDPEVLKYLREQAENNKDFVLIENEKNEGFPVGCNIGLSAVKKDNDVFFLNNDAVLMSNSLFWLKMGLYSDRRNGAAGAVTNSAPSQEVSSESFEPYLKEASIGGVRAITDIKRSIAEAGNGEHRWWRTISLEDAIETAKNYAKDHNVPMWNPLEVRFRLTGFAVLLRREVADNLMIDNGRHLFDERYTPGYFEDDDLGIRISLAGYRQVLCHNAFIYHNGGTGFAGKNDAMEKSREKFVEKWGFDVWGFTLPEEEKIAALIQAEEERSMHLSGAVSDSGSLSSAGSAGGKVSDLKLYNRNFRILDLSAGLGTTLSAIKYQSQGSFTAGITNSDVFSGLGKFMADEMISGDPELVTFPWPEHSFDYILAGDMVVGAQNAEALIAKLKMYLAEGGQIL